MAYFESFGFDEKATGAPMPKDALFEIYSMTKPLVSAAAMMLVEEGRLQLPILSQTSCQNSRAFRSVSPSSIQRLGNSSTRWFRPIGP